MSWIRAGAATLALAVGLLAVAVPTAHAQGQGQGQGHGHGPPPGRGPGAGGLPPGQTGAAIDAAAGLGPTGTAEFTVRNFGSWVDDAYVLPRGEAWLGIGLGYWRLPYADQVDAPMLSTSVGVARRVQVAATLPISSVHYPDGFNTHGLGDAYFSAKVGVRTSDRGVGVAVSPVVEVLSDGSWPTPDGGTIGRVHWALPINLEYRGRGWRTYGSAGYFSRGAVFGSGTVDIGVGPRAGVLGLLSHTYSTRDPLVATGIDASRSRTDASGGLYVLPRPSISLYALAGRTLSTIDDYASKFFVAGGVSFRVAQAAKATP